MYHWLTHLRRTSPTFVRKKAALTLLRIYRKHPDVIPAAEWALRIVSLMDDMDLVSVMARKVDGLRLTQQKGCSDMCNQPSNGYGAGPPRRICGLLHEVR